MKNLIILAAGVCIATSCSQIAGTSEPGSDSTNSTNSTNNTNTANAGNRTDTATTMWVKDESITEANAYSDLFLDSAAIDAFIRNNKLDNSDATAMHRFYDVRNNQFAWFASDGLTEQGRGLWSLYAESTNPEKKMKDKMDSLLQHDSILLMKTDSSIIQTELKFTKQLIAYAKSNNNGFITPSNVYFLAPAKNQDPLQLADSILNKQRNTGLYANNKHYNLLKQQLGFYYNAAKNGDWQPITATKKISKGMKSPIITSIKKRLSATNDYITGDTSNLFTDTLVTAIKSFQLRNGLTPNGSINDSLVTIFTMRYESSMYNFFVLHIN